MHIIRSRSLGRCPWLFLRFFFLQKQPMCWWCSCFYLQLIHWLQTSNWWRRFGLSPSIETLITLDKSADDVSIFYCTFGICTLLHTFSLPLFPRNYNDWYAMPKKKRKKKKKGKTNLTTVLHIRELPHLHMKLAVWFFFATTNSKNPMIPSWSLVSIYNYSFNPDQIFTKNFEILELEICSKIFTCGISLIFLQVSSSLPTSLKKNKNMCCASQETFHKRKVWENFLQVFTSFRTYHNNEVVCIPERSQRVRLGLDLSLNWNGGLPCCHVTYVILSVEHCIRSTEQSSVCRKLRQPGCVSLVATVNLDLESSDLVKTVDRSCSKYDADRDTRVEGKPNENNDSKEHSKCKWPEDTQKSTGDFDRYTTIMAALSKKSSETTTKIEATLVRAVKYETVSRSKPSYRLVGLVVGRPPREWKIPGSNPACDVDFFRGRVKKPLCPHNTDCMLLSLCSTFFTCVYRFLYSNAIYHTEQQKSLKSYSKNEIGVKKKLPKKAILLI